MYMPTPFIPVQHLFKDNQVPQSRAQGKEKASKVWDLTETMTSKQVKNQVRDNVEHGFDTLHKIADVVTFPLAPLDGAIHGAARGILNWLTDSHPEDRAHDHNHSKNGSQPPQYPAQQQNYSGQPPNYPGQPPNYPGPPYPGYPSDYPSRRNGKYDNSGQQKIKRIKNKTGNNKGDNNGAVKIGNFGGA